MVRQFSLFPGRALMLMDPLQIAEKGPGRHDLNAEGCFHIQQVAIEADQGLGAGSQGSSEDGIIFRITAPLLVQRCWLHEINLVPEPV